MVIFFKIGFFGFWWLTCASCVIDWTLHSDSDRTISLITLSLKVQLRFFKSLTASVTLKLNYINDTWGSVCIFKKKVTQIILQLVLWCISAATDFPSQAFQHLVQCRYPGNHCLFLLQLLDCTLMRSGDKSAFVSIECRV